MMTLWMSTRTDLSTASSPLLQIILPSRTLRSTAKQSQKPSCNLSTLHFTRYSSTATASIFSICASTTFLVVLVALGTTFVDISSVSISSQNLKLPDVLPGRNASPLHLIVLSCVRIWPSAMTIGHTTMMRPPTVLEREISQSGVSARSVG